MSARLHAVTRPCLPAAHLQSKGHRLWSADFDQLTSSVPSISSCSRLCWQWYSCSQRCSRQADPDRRVASLAVPWQSLHTQEKLHVPSTFVWFELDRPYRLHAIWRSNSVVACTLTSARESQEYAYTPTTLSAPIRLASLPVAIHMTFGPNGVATRRKLLPSLFWNGVRPSTPVRCQLIAPAACSASHAKVS